MKNCKKCHIELIVNDNWNVSFKKKRYYICKKCRKEYATSYRDKNKCVLKEKRRVYYSNNREVISYKDKQYYKENTEVIKKRAKDFYYNNLEKCKDTRKKYYRANKEKAREYKRDWLKDNQHLKNAANARRRASKLQATPSWADLEKIKIVYEKAIWLSTITGLENHVDHVLPLNGKNVSGLHTWNNLQILEKSLNCIKSNNITN